MKFLVMTIVGFVLLGTAACNKRTQSLGEGQASQAQEQSRAMEIPKAADLPLPPSGPYCEKSLHAAMASLTDEEARSDFELGWRLVFTSDKSRKDPALAVDRLNVVRQRAPKFAPTFRVAGYAYFMGGNFENAIRSYHDAIQIDPNYADAHYSLAAILAMSGADPAAAREHLDRALALGVEDTMNVKEMLTAQAGQPKAPGGAMPPGHPPAGGPGGAPPADVPTDGEAIPLKLTGIGSVAEFERGAQKLSDPALKKSLEIGFRYTFSTKTQFRDRAAAKAEFEKVITADPNCAAAYRGLAYVLFDLGQPTESVANYEKAIQVDPEYGEAHYALAFIQAAEQHEEGLKHFKRAKELGVPDERKLGERFYPEAK